MRQFPTILMADALVLRQKQRQLFSISKLSTRTIGDAYESCLGEGPLQQRPKALGQPGAGPRPRSTNEQRPALDDNRRLPQAAPMAT